MFSPISAPSLNLSSKPTCTLVKYRIFSFNVNGIRAATRKGFLDWLQKEKADIVAIQETKAHPDQLDDNLRNPDGYEAYWHSADRKGYSGVATFTRVKPQFVSTGGLSSPELIKEGRILRTDFPEFTLFNVYFPNGKKDQERLDFKMKFYAEFKEMCQKLLDEGKSIVVCGDVNTAHTEIDLARPKANEKISGFLPIERAWIDEFLKIGFKDAFRELHKDETGHYTWWSMRARGARERNVGWRIDYFFISDDLMQNLKSASIYPDVKLSDHCPLDIVLEF